MKRYDLLFNGLMEGDNGVWVKHSDAEAELAHIEADNARLRTRNQQLEEALKPFAKLADWFPPRVTDSTLSIYETPDGHIFTVGEIRIAARVLADEQPADA